MIAEEVDRHHLKAYEVDAEGKRKSIDQGLLYL